MYNTNNKVVSSWLSTLNMLTVDGMNRHLTVTKKLCDIPFLLGVNLFGHPVYTFN